MDIRSRKCHPAHILILHSLIWLKNQLYSYLQGEGLKNNKYLIPCLDISLQQDALFLNMTAEMSSISRDSFFGLTFHETRLDFGNEPSSLKSIPWKYVQGSWEPITDWHYPGNSPTLHICGQFKWRQRRALDHPVEESQSKDYTE